MITITDEEIAEVVRRFKTTHSHELLDDMLERASKDDEEAIYLLISSILRSDNKDDRMALVAHGETRRWALARQEEISNRTYETSAFKIRREEIKRLL